MLFQRIKRSDPEVIYTIVYNVSAATIADGYPVVWDIVTPDGVRVSKPATATLSLLVGIAAQEILDSTYGKVQVYGYKASAYMTNDTSVTVVAGDMLVPVTATWYLTPPAAQTGAGTKGLIMAAESYATGVAANANKKVFIKCL